MKRNKNNVKHKFKIIKIFYKNIKRRRNKKKKRSSVKKEKNMQFMVVNIRMFL